MKVNNLVANKPNYHGIDMTTQIIFGSVRRRVLVKGGSKTLRIIKTG